MIQRFMSLMKATKQCLNSETERANQIETIIENENNKRCQLVMGIKSLY